MRSYITSDVCAWISGGEAHYFFRDFAFLLIVCNIKKTNAKTTISKIEVITAIEFALSKSIGRIFIPFFSFCEKKGKHKKTVRE